jgi:hypothetical protein
MGVPRSRRHFEGSRGTNAARRQTFRRLVHGRAPGSLTAIGCQKADGVDCGPHASLAPILTRQPFWFLGQPSSHRRRNARRVSMACSGRVGGASPFHLGLQPRPCQAQAQIYKREFMIYIYIASVRVRASVIQSGSFE